MVNFLIMGQSLYKRTLDSGIWNFILRASKILMNFVKLIIIARILPPDEIGLFGAALLAVSIIETFSQTGISAALIQKKEDISDFLDTAWSVLLLRGILIFAVCFFFAPAASAFLGEKGLTPVIRVISVSFLIAGFNNIGMVYFEKELKFQKKFAVNFIANIFDFTVTVILTLVWRNIAALMAGYIVNAVVIMILGYSLHPHRPRFSLNRERTAEMFKFGKWITLSSVLLFLIMHGDDIFVSKYLGLAMLAFYQFAYRVSNMPATEIAAVVTQVSFPAFSLIQDDPVKLRTAFRQVLSLTALVSFYLTAGIMVLAPDIIAYFLKPEWMAAAVPLQILAVWGAVRSIAGINTSVLNAVKRPDIITKLSAVKLLILAVLIFPLTKKWGITGTSVAVVISSVLITPVTLLFSYKLSLKGRMRDIALACTPQLAGLLAAASSILIFREKHVTVILMIEKFLILSVLYAAVLISADAITGTPVRKSIAVVLRKAK